MAFELPALPYSKDALAPHISPETLSFHYDKHHNAYVTKLNAAVSGTKYASMSLEDIIKNSEGGTFNNAAQVYNHSFYWNCLTPNGGGAATGKTAEIINSKWGSFDKFKEEFTANALSNFASGWTWLVKTSTDEYQIINTDDAGCPLTASQIPLMTVDIWEHAYYIDYRNARPKYLEAFWNLVNWDFVSKNIERSLSK